MKTKAFLTCCLAAAALAVSLIPVTAQDAIDRDDPAEREIADLQSARTAEQRQRLPDGIGARSNFGTANAPLPDRNLTYSTNNEIPSGFATATVPAQPGWRQDPSQNRFSVAGTSNIFRGQNHFSAFSPELAKAINESHQSIAKLIKELKTSEVDEDKQELKSKIKEELDIQYDAYLTHHEKPLKELEDRVAKLRDEFEARKTAKDDLVKLRLDTIWYDSLGLGWPDNRRSNNQSFFRDYPPTASPFGSGQFPPIASPAQPRSLPGMFGEQPTTPDLPVADRPKRLGR